MRKILTTMSVKVLVEGRVPPMVKKDAHDIILDFIRSRPPLKPVSLKFFSLVFTLKIVRRPNAAVREVIIL